MKTDILITGAGPVGLTMAAELARFGLTTRIIDKNSARTDKSKALVLWSRTLELIDRMGPACTGRFISAGLKVDSANIFSGREKIAGVDMTQVDSPHKFVLMIAQSETERLLEEHLATLGVNVERQLELKTFETATDGVSCTLLHPDGREEIAEVNYLIGCDGAHSTVRHQLGMEFHGEKLLSDFVLADLHLTGVPGAPAINIFWHAEGILALFPLGGTRYRVIADTGESAAGSIGEGNRPAPTLDEIQKILDVRGPGEVQATDPVWLGAFSINERKVANYRAGRVFLAGDAAHVHSPAGGQGMNTGMQDAVNLAWKLALVSRGIAAPELVSSYSAERSAIAKLVLEATGKATSMAMLKGGIKQSIRNHIASLVFGFAPAQHMMANVLSELSVGYPESPLNAQSAHPHDGPKPGKRAPIRENETPVGSGTTPRFALFADDNAAVRSILAKYSDLVESSPRKPYVEGGIWLVRPDGYVALAAKPDALNELDTYLAQLAKPRAATAN
jgi:2-polyprenyl-6-methoxyphenol hydroxylase-like FAD-dependent oxidoreductase